MKKGPRQAIQVQLPDALKGRWRLGERLGKGGQGVVHRLHSVAGAPDAVIKFVLATEAYDLERFRREVTTLVSISHPNVIRLLEHGTEPPFYVTPKGVPLDEYWDEVRASCEAPELFNRSAAIIEQLAQGLAAVHERQLVHRDIKPQNVIVLENERPTLADFGIVHIPDEERITERPAGNRFARDLSSLYDPKLAPRAGDCLCLANVWAWMLALIPERRHGNVHWRFHRWVPDPRAEVAKTVLAICSEPTLCPIDGAAFLDLLRNRFGLSELVVPRSPSAPHSDDLRSAYLLAVAGREQHKVDVRSEMEVLSLAILPQLRLLVTTLRETASTLHGSKMPADLHVTALSEPLTADEILRAILDSEERHYPHILAALRCGDDTVMDFGVRLMIAWHLGPHENGSKFSIHVEFEHEHDPNLRHQLSWSGPVLPSGRVDTLDELAVASRIREFFLSREAWRQRTKPRVNNSRAFFHGR